MYLRRMALSFRMTNPHTSDEIDKVSAYEFYPNVRHTETIEYDDDDCDGERVHRRNKSVSTLIESDVKRARRANLTITIHPTAGNFDGFVKDKKTELRINVTEKPKKLCR